MEKSHFKKKSLTKIINYAVMENHLTTDPNQAGMTIDQLSQQIVRVQDVMQVQASHAVNLSFTARNWLIGRHIVEYEQHGQDRAQYGDALLKTLAKRINRRGLGERRLYEFRQMYSIYPQLEDEIVHYLIRLQDAEKLRLPTAISCPTVPEKWQTSPNRLFNRLSATHLILLSNINDDLKRAFYEQEAIAGCWTVKELDRQVSSLYFECMGLSKDKLAMRQYVETGAETLPPQHTLHDPVTLDTAGNSKNFLKWLVFEYICLFLYPRSIVVVFVV